MLIVVSPAKTLDYESPLATKKYSEPAMLERAADLVAIMATKSPQELSRLMSVSPSLGETTFERFQDWEQPFTPANSRPALLAFRGDVYIGMNAPNSFSERDYTHAQKTLRILSGLYGVLRPLDLMQPYRLEMGSKVKNPAGKDLYAFWGSTITESLNMAIDRSPGTKALVNLASNEYYGSVCSELLTAPVITPVFLDQKGDDYKNISFFAKRARGAMAGWIIRNRVKSLRALHDFDDLGYRYDSSRSTSNQPVFTRHENQGLT